MILNEACSSGCGALIEGFSRSLGYTQWSFSDVALQAKQPVDLGTRCTVFMTSRVRHAQKQGIPAADIAAGLAYSVVRNALYKVIGYTSAEQLGKQMVVQGGTFMSDAVLRAFELECGCEVTRPSIANLMGAYVLRCWRETRYWLQRDQVLLQLNRPCSAPVAGWSNQQHGTRRCMGCANNCLLTISSFSNLKGDDPAARVFVTGNRCERGGFAQEIQHKPENLFAYQQQLLAAYNDDFESESILAFDKPVIGIPRVLDLHASYPLADISSTARFCGQEYSGFEYDAVSKWRSGC